MPIRVIVDNKPYEFKVIRFSDGASSVKAPEDLPEDFEGAVLTVENEPVDSYYSLIGQAYSIILDKSLECDLTLNLPYFPYARADRKFGENYANPLDLFFQFLSRLDFDAYIVHDVHNADAIMNCAERWGLNTIYFNSRLDCFRSTVNGERKLKELLKKDPVFCAPDAGAAAGTCEIAEYYGNEYVICKKTRNPHNGYITGLEIVFGTNVDGRTAIITDDICDGGATFDIAARALKEAGAKEVILYVTHGIFSKGIESLTEVDQIFFYQKVTK